MNVAGRRRKDESIGKLELETLIALTRANGSASAAARNMGASFPTFYMRLKRLQDRFSYEQSPRELAKWLSGKDWWVDGIEHRPLP